MTVIDELNRQRLFSALIMLVMALFVASGVVRGAWRAKLRLAAILGFAATALLALAEFYYWW